MTAVTTTHIWLDDRGIAWIDNTNVKVKEVVLDKIAWGMTPEQIHEEHPHLSLAQVHAAFTYYYDHKDVVDAQIAEDDRYVEEMRAKASESPGRRRLREMGLLP